VGKKKTCGRLVDLALELKELAGSGEQKRRRKLWADVVNLRTTRPVVNAYLYEDVWAAELAGDSIRSTDPFERAIETQLAFKVWRFRHFHDDYPVGATVTIPAARPPRTAPMWGVEMEVTRTAAAGAYKELPGILRYEDIGKLRTPRYEIDNAETARVVERVQALTGGAL